MQLASSTLRVPSVRFRLPRTFISARLAAIFLIVAATIWHLAYLVYNCPLELAADEAHYWDWSRHLDWSYYSKGPLVAWIIRASCELFGGLSQLICGSEIFAIRLPAILCGTAFLAGLYVLAARTLGDERRALAVVAVALSLPIMAAGATLMTIDAPFTCAWIWALVFAHSAIFRGTPSAWFATGIALGIGILAKYTMVLLIPCFGLFMLTSPAGRRELRRSGFWIACLIAALSTLPIVIWNIQNDWITLRHVSWQAGGRAIGIRWMGPLRFIGEQAGLLLIFWFACWAAAMWINRPGHVAKPRRLFLWWTSLPVFAVFMFFSLKTNVQLNWPIAGYITGLILAVDWLADRLTSASAGWRCAHLIGLIMTTVLGFGLTTIVHYPRIVQPILARVSGTPTKDSPLPMRRYDPTVRLRGWQFLANSVDEARLQLALAGEEAQIATSFWNMPGEIAFYGKGHPEVYCFGPPLGQRMSQYDLWQPNPLWNPELYLGQTFIFVGDLAPSVIAAFDDIGPSWYVEYTESGHVLCYWQITVCRGYRGFGPPNTWFGGTLRF